MAYPTELLAADIEGYLQQHEKKSLLRFITCGSVDDGKSTLIGRLLYDAGMLYEDQISAIESESRRWGTQGNELDFALLVDGLAAEREQGITIDVAYRYFSTEGRKFIVADTPGHEQYTRNMVTGASTADLAIILIDARKGVLTQTRRHSYLVRLVGIRNIILAVNKMDLVNYDEAKFRNIAAAYCEFANKIGLTDVIPIPICALKGENIVERSAAMPWYQGPVLMPALEAADVDETRLQALPMRLQIQWVSRPSPDFRGFSGMLASGSLRTGDRVCVQPSGQQTRIARIVTPEGDRDQVIAGQSVTVTLSDEVAVSRGDVISMVDAPAAVADHFECTLIWMSEDPMTPGRSYLVKIGTKTVSATISEPHFLVNIDTLEQLSATRLQINEIGSCKLVLSRPVPFDPYEDNRTTGGFIVVDRMTNNTVGAGMLHLALRQSHIQLQHLDVDKQARAEQKRQKPVVLWLTGISGAGKSTIANLLVKKLYAMARHSYLLDGDNLRHGLNKDLGFTVIDRAENVRRIAEIAKLMVDAGLIVVVSCISPFLAERKMARNLFSLGEFIEIHVDTPLVVAELRDVKGLYAKARRGEIKDFTGIDSPYEPPESPELRLSTIAHSVEQSVDHIIAALLARGILD